MQIQVNKSERLFQRGTKVFLQLPGELRAREIGAIYGGVYRKNVEPITHTHNKSNSIGFNYILIRDGQFRYVCVHVGTVELWTYREFILAHGFFLQYKRQGYERQIFLKYSLFGIEHARRWYDEHHAIKIQSRKLAQKSEQIRLAL
jgi:hypothetical protein